MSLFNTIVKGLENFFSNPPQPTSVQSSEDEAEHLALLTQSANRIRDTLGAIESGRLIADSSVTTNAATTAQMRYQDLIAQPKPDTREISR
ncbi:MAG: hypothetical protein MK052_05570 [Alphaproteobacteria bacterium]|nr:hypothetical protein [Alphaproteobacteria bacterium]